MAINLKGRSFLTLLDFTPSEVRFLIHLSRDLKAAKYGGYEQQRLKGKEIALIFEKDSTRTRSALRCAGRPGYSAWIIAAMLAGSPSATSSKGVKISPMVSTLLRTR